jgi:hypothetical protein
VDNPTSSLDQAKKKDIGPLIDELVKLQFKNLKARLIDKSKRALTSL